MVHFSTECRNTSQPSALKCHFHFTRASVQSKIYWLFSPKQLTAFSFCLCADCYNIVGSWILKSFNKNHSKRPWSDMTEKKKKWWNCRIPTLVQGDERIQKRCIISQVIYRAVKVSMNQWARQSCCRQWQEGSAEISWSKGTRLSQRRLPWQIQDECLGGEDVLSMLRICPGFSKCSLPSWRATVGVSRMATITIS